MNASETHGLLRTQAQDVSRRQGFNARAPIMREANRQRPPGFQKIDAGWGVHLAT